MAAAARTIPEGRLRLARSPTTDLAAAALQAQQAAELQAADFIVIAVDPGAAGDVLVNELVRVTDVYIAHKRDRDARDRLARRGA